MRRLTNSLRALALCGALALTVFAWRATVAPPSVLTDARGNPVLINGRPVVREKAWVANLIWMVVSAIIQYALAPRPPKRKPAALEDFDIPQAVQGAPFAMIFGEVEDKSPVVAWFGDLSSKPIKKGKK